MSVSSVAQLGAELDIEILHIFWDLGNRFINPEPLMITVWTSIHMKAIDFTFKKSASVDLWNNLLLSYLKK